MKNMTPVTSVLLLTSFLASMDFHELEEQVDRRYRCARWSGRIGGRHYNAERKHVQHRGLP